MEKRKMWATEVALAEMAICHLSVWQADFGEAEDNALKEIARDLTRVINKLQKLRQGSECRQINPENF